MIPNQSWFPTNLQDRAAWFNNFADQFATLAPSLGFTNTEISSTNDDSAVMQFLAEADLEVTAYEKAVRQYRKVITEGDIGDTTPAFPANPTLALPKEIPTGMFERLIKLVERIRVAPNYTEETGALLGILPVQKESLNPNDVKPTLKLTESFAGYKFSAAVGRLGYTAFKIQICRANTEIWTDAAFGTSSPLEVHVTPTTPGQPERVQVRAILMDKNETVGVPSDMQYATLNP